MALMRWIQVHDDDERHPRALWKTLKEGAKSGESSGRRANPDYRAAVTGIDAGCPVGILCRFRGDWCGTGLGRDFSFRSDMPFPVLGNTRGDAVTQDTPCNLVSVTLTD